MSAVQRVLAYTRPDRPLSLAEHLERYGPLPDVAGEALIEAVDRSGLRGRGGADFPVATKMRAVRAGRRARVVVANGAEGEPASAKDKLLMTLTPQLVIDGAVLAAQAVGARDAVICVAESAREAAANLERALSERADGVRLVLVRVADGYVSGEESALVHQLNGGPAKPTFVPPRPFERGVRGRPTLVQNVETLAHLAQIARFGADWFRECGTNLDPGTRLVTISGAVSTPGVYELECGTPLRELVAHASGLNEAVQAFLVGGYFGTWFAADPALELELAHSRLQLAGGSLGAGVVVALPESVCGIAQSARIMRYLADQSVGQCGPCVHGLATVADATEALAAGRANASVTAWLEHWSAQIEGRGACHHPDGAVRFLRSSLLTFADEVEAHLAGHCEARSAVVR